MIPDISVVIVSFNTKDLTRECLQTLHLRSEGLTSEVIVVDNASRDGSADMIEQEFPYVRVLRSEANLGFAGANNLAFPFATGRYVVLLNTDAFPHEGALQKSVALMDANKSVGLAGGRLVGRDGELQPSARMFPSIINEGLMLSGLSAKFSRSRWFGRADRTWADPMKPASVDWVPGAYSIIRREALEKTGYFDEDFFLYYEEVDLCKRIREAGFSIQYWPEIVVTHIGGESSKTVQHLTLSRSGSQLTLWRMRSELLYYRKHHGAQAWLVKEFERQWHRLRAWKNARNEQDASRTKSEDSLNTARLMQQAWMETVGGRVSPARPWR